MPVALAEKNPAEGHALTGRTQADPAQHCLDIMPGTTGFLVRGQPRRRSGHGTRLSHLRLVATPAEPSPVCRKRTVAFATYTQSLPGCNSVATSSILQILVLRLRLMRRFAVSTLVGASGYRHLCRIRPVCYELTHGNRPNRSACRASRE